MYTSTIQSYLQFRFKLASMV